VVAAFLTSLGSKMTPVTLGAFRSGGASGGCEAASMLSRACESASSSSNGSELSACEALQMSHQGAYDEAMVLADPCHV